MSYKIPVPGMMSGIRPKMAEKDKFPAHQKKKRTCKSLDRSPSSDWVTCKHPKNPTAIRVCGHNHCPVI